MKERNVGIDILKFLAVLLITNSHLQFLYGKYSMLATGGAIGNALFFFCSGFTLFLKPIENANDFPNWYKRRINRIYPTVFAVAIIFSAIFGLNCDINWVILHGGRWFVTYIMVYYVFIYFIGVYFKRRINLILVGVSLAMCIWFFAMDRSFPFSMYGDNREHLTWLLYFVFMLFGAKMGMSSFMKQFEYQWRNLMLAIFCIIIFYTMNGLTARIEQLGFLHVFSFIPLLLAIFFLYLWGEGKSMKLLYNTPIGHFVIRFVGGLCLEIYLIQNCLFTDKLNFLFPFSIPIFFVIVVIAAYLVRCLARFISQTFKEAPYNWKKMVSIY